MIICACRYVHLKYNVVDQVKFFELVHGVVLECSCETQCGEPVNNCVDWSVFALLHVLMRHLLPYIDT